MVVRGCFDSGDGGETVTFTPEQMEYIDRLSDFIRQMEAA